MDPAREQVSDEELARQTQAGSLTSFEELVFRYETRILRLLEQRCHCESDARELTQVTFLTAYRSIHRFKPSRSFGAWLFTIARHKFIDHCRAGKRNDGAPREVEVCDVNDPSVILSGREEEADIWRQARGLLSADQFEALWLRFQEDMSVREIARVLGRTQTSVKVLMFRARRKLLRELPREDGETIVTAAHSAQQSLGRTFRPETKIPVTL